MSTDHYQADQKNKTISYWGNVIVKEGKRWCIMWAACKQEKQAQSLTCVSGHITLHMPSEALAAEKFPVVKFHPTSFLIWICLINIYDTLEVKLI